MHGRVARRLGVTVRRLRQARGWTMKAAAERFGVVAVTLRRIESGVGNPSLAILFQIARHFRVSLSDLFRR
jgi:transcriptional regulator with XRE-family HTH domain